MSSSGCIDNHFEPKVFGPGVVTGRSGSIGSVFYVEDDFWPLNTTLYVKNFHGNDPHFVFHLLKSLDLKKFGGGAGVPTLNRNIVHNELVIIPNSLDEQKRIVALLDEAFAAIATATANTEKNLANAKELFENFLNDSFSSGEDWDKVQLGDVADFKNGLNFSKSSKGESIKIVGVKDFKSNYWAPINQLDFVHVDGSVDDGYLLKQNDILTVRSNGNKQLIGRCILVDELSEKLSYSGFTIRIRLHSSNVIPTYLTHFLKSKSVHEELVGGGGGANISNLNQKGLSALVVRYPSKSEQSRIVKHIETLQSKTSELEGIFGKKLNLLTELRHSLLHKAFTGELTANPKAVDKALTEAGV